MDIFEQAFEVDLKKKEKESKKNSNPSQSLSEFNNLEEVKEENKKLFKNQKKKKNRTQSETNNLFKKLNIKFDYTKLNLLTIKIACTDLNLLINKPISHDLYNLYLNLYNELNLKKINFVFLENEFFNDLFLITKYKTSNALHLYSDDSYVYLLIEKYFSDILNKNKIKYYFTGTIYIDRIKNQKYFFDVIEKTKISIESIPDIKKCFLCPYFNLDNHTCSLNSKS